MDVGCEEEKGMSYALKPCPFCAAPASFIKITGVGYRIRAQHEDWCPFTMRIRDKLDAYITKDEAAAAWNTREGTDGA